MPKIRINLEASISNGQALTFKSPADCSDITGLIIYYQDGNTTASKTFQFADAHGNNVGSVSLFAENVLVKVLLDTDLNRAYVQNADTNAYIESTFVKTVNGSKPDRNGNVTVAGGGGGGLSFTDDGEGNVTITGSGGITDDGEGNVTINGGGTSPPGESIPGEDGGYYTPDIEQVDESTMKVSFTASKEGMPTVQPKSITLPQGPKGDPGNDGNDYDLTQKDMKEIAEMAAGMVEVPSVVHGIVPRVEISDSEVTLEPNVFYVFPEMASLSITLGGEVDRSVVQEYKFRFISGTTPTTLSLPENIIGEIAVEANSIVELSIIDGFAVCQTWGVSA